MKYHFIIIEHNSFEYLKEFINSLQNIYDSKITIFNNNSSYNVEENFSTVAEVINSTENLGYGKAINQVVKISEADYIFICNSDLIFFENTFSDIDNFISSNPEIKLFGIQQLYPVQKKQYSYGEFPSFKEIIKKILFINQLLIRIDKSNNIREVEYVDGAFIVVERKTFNEIGGFDEDYFFYSEDADLCFRARKKNIPSIINPNIKIIHHRGASSSTNLISSKKAKLFINGISLFLDKHHSILYKKTYFSLFRIQLILSLIVNLIMHLFTKDSNYITKISNNKELLKAI